MIEPLPLAELIFVNRTQTLTAIVLVLISALTLWLTYRNSLLPQKRKRWAMSLKMLGFLFLAFCLMEPMWSTNTVKPGSNIFVLLADNSAGMGIHDADAAQSRGEQMRELLGAQPPLKWHSKILEDFQLRNYQFDSRLQRVTSFAELDFNGNSSALATSLDVIKERFKNNPLAGVLLFTDGNLTDLPADPSWMQGLPPIFPIILGEDRPQPDAGIQLVAITETNFEDAPVTVIAELAFSGMGGQTITTQVSNADQKLVAAETYTVRSDTDKQSVRFLLKPNHAGISHYTLNLATAAGNKEATLGNNRYALSIDRGSGPYRILYVSGRPNWEYKFLRRSLDDDDQVDLVGLIRIAKREPKFDFRGRSGETSNPLFRGFKDGADEGAEQFDQAVVIRMNTRDETELQGGFPKTAEALFDFQGIIIDDLEARFFSPDQMKLVERFVSFRGGGLLMLGGQESFHQGGYDKTAIGNMLPVYLDRLTEEPDYEPVRMNLTREGLLQPWIRLRQTEESERHRLMEMPPFNVLNRLPAIKPGAQVIAEVQDAADRSYPAIAVQRFGAGQTAAITIGDIWRWGFEDETQHEDMARKWRQILRWMVKDVPRQVTVDVNYEAGSNQPCVFEINLRDKAYLPQDEAVVQCIITLPDGETVELSAQPVPDERGKYTGEYLPQANGHYTVRTVATDQNGLEIGHHETSWSINRNLDEFRSLTPNRSMMEELANQTGGEMVELANIEEFASGLIQREMPVMETWSRPAWHTPLLFILALGCFVGEWGIRRKGGDA